ncbi:MAG: hypothetical protein KatS3mg057_2159 [Herpetosiphonaceae bacterium]|nr:MAG: hypothetical protein KatS3mg057_2159 [Herpetosiphonaceae bacterium]
MLGQLVRLAKGREWQWNAVAITALGTLLLVMNAYYLGWPLWGIALMAIIPWVPLVTMKVLWSSKHYGFMAIFFAIMILQLGHFGEHFIQLLQFITSPNCTWGWQRGCPDAHGIFSALDNETVHFVWDGLVLVATLVVRWHFRHVKNVWLSLAVIAAGLHQIEHTYLWFTYFFYREIWDNGGFFFSLYLPSKSVHAGILGLDGVLGTLFPTLNSILPSRINLHFVYNTVVLSTMTGAFLTQTRYIYDEWLAKALPRLSDEQLIAATQKAGVTLFPAGSTIFSQGDPADKLYIISKGQVEVLRRERNGTEVPIARLAEGQYFGEIGVLGRTQRTATVRAVTDVEALVLNLELFKEMMASSAEAYKDVDVVLRRRLVQLGAVHGLALKDAVEADSDTVLRTKMIRDRLQLLQDAELRQVLGSPIGSSPAVYAHQQPALAAVATPVAAQPARAEAAVESRQQPAGEQTVVAQPAASGQLRGVLQVTAGPSAGTRLEIRGQRVLIGRRGATPSPGALVLELDDKQVSRQHLEISEQADGLYVRDLGSANGSWLNGQRLGGDAVRLAHNAELRLGPTTTLTFSAAAPEHPSVPPAQSARRLGSLMLRSGAAAGTRFEINGPRTIVGRAGTGGSSDATLIQIDDKRISRQHLEISEQGDGLYVRDLGSANGSWLNGRQLGGEPVRLENGAELRLGSDCVLVYQA